MKPFVLDVHTHSVSSGHFTKDKLADMIKYAAAAGIKLLGVSEHGPAIPHSCSLSYFQNLSLAPRTRMGISILYGAEANILDFSGRLDLPGHIMERLDYCIASMHLPCLKPGTAAENTDAYIHAMENPHIRIIAHPDDARYPVDFPRLMEAAMDFHVLLEINNASLLPDSYRSGARPNDLAILKLCKKYHYPVLLSSDSHGCANIGNFRHAYALAQEAGLPDALILNFSVGKFLGFLERR